VIRRRLRLLVRLVARIPTVLVVAAATGALVVFLTGPGGSISCVAPPFPARPEPFPRWVIAAGAPALIAALVSAFFALGAEGARWRLVGLVFTLAVAAGTFYSVYQLLPISCRP
jgi:hypothetical protein